MKKILIISFIFILSACRIKETGVKTCLLKNDPFTINYHFEYFNNKITNLLITSEIKLDVFNNNEELLNAYLDNYKKYQIENDSLIIYEDIIIDINEYYMLDKTINYYKGLGFNCF